MRKAARRALWLAKGAALFWGAALTLALVFGGATVALAAVPGDPFRLGRVNFVNNAITTLVGTKSRGPMLVVDNNSAVVGSRALDLRVAPGRAPIVASPGAGKAPNLNADRLDGLEPSQIKGAKAYAHVSPNPSGPPIIEGDRRFGFTSVIRDSTGRYCLTAPGVNSDTRLPVVSVDWNTTSAPQGSAAAMVDHFGCLDGGFRVITKRTTLSGGVLTDTYENDVGFVIAVQ